MLSWNEKIAAILDRLRTPDELPIDIPGQIDIPYYNRGDVEAMLLEFTQQKLREIPESELDAVGSVAIARVTMASGATISLDKVKLLAVAVKIYAGDSFFAPAVWNRPAQFRQIANVPATTPAYIAAYTTYDGKFYYIGSSARVTWLVEPTLATARTNAVILPPVYDEECIEWVVRQMQITNYIPQQ